MMSNIDPRTQGTWIMTDLKPPTIGFSIIELHKYPEQPHRSGVSLYQMPEFNAQDIHLDVHLTLPL